MKVQTNNYINPTFNSKYHKLNDEAMYLIADKLNLKVEDIFQHTNTLNVKQQNFLAKLVERYNCMYYYSKNKENPQNVFKIAQMIENPKSFHYNIVSYVSGTFENLSNVLSSISNKKEAVFAEKFNKRVLKNKPYSENILTDILQSPNKKEYINNIDKYKSYLILNAKNKDAIKILDKKIAENNYDSEIYDKQRNLNHVFRNNSIQKLKINDALEKHYSKLGIDFMNKFAKFYDIPDKCSNADKSNLIEIYKTCNPDNIYLRDLIIRSHHMPVHESGNFGQEIAEMLELFKKIDNGDKYTTKFIDKFLWDSENSEAIHTLNEILGAVPADKAYVFYNNLSKILQFTKPGEERINALKNELTNFRFKNESSENYYKYKKYATKYGFGKTQSKFSKRIDFLKNEFNKLRYYFIQKFKDNASKQIIKSEAVPTGTTEIKNTAQKSIHKPISNQIVTKNINATSFIDFTKIQKQKIEAQEGVRQFIRKNLHPSVVNEQERVYVSKATKMRLKMMPEILASIKETRADLRKNGIKRPKISNFDAVDLYTRINGNNKKLVNYMLKKRNTDGRRMYNVIDIIEELGKVHKRIILEKLKPAQARVLYDDVFQSKVNEFGKLKGQKS